MADYSILNGTLSGIGSALRYKLNENEYYKPSIMPTAINNIRTIRPAPLPQGPIGQIYIFADGYAQYDIVPYAIGSSLSGDDIFKISTSIGVNVWDKNVSGSHYIYSEGDAPLYLASSVVYAPEHLNYQEINGIFCKTLDHPIVNLNNIYDLGLISVEQIYNWSPIYTNDLTGLDKLKIIAFSGLTFALSFRNNIIVSQTNWNSQTQNYDNIVTRNAIGIKNTSTITEYYNGKYWCGKYVRNFWDTYYGYYGANTSKIHTPSIAKCGESVESMNYTYAYNERITEGEIGSRIIYAYEPYYYCNNMTDIYLNGGNTLSNIKVGFMSFYGCGINSINGCTFHFNKIDSPLIWNLYSMFYYCQTKKVPSISDSIVPNISSLQYYFGDGQRSMKDPSNYIFLEECPSFGNIIFNNPGRAQIGYFWGDNVSVFPSWGDIMVRNPGTFYTPGTSSNKKSQSSLPPVKNFGSFGNIYVNGNIDFTYELFIGEIINCNNNNSYNTLEFLETEHCQFNDIIAEKNITIEEYEIQPHLNNMTSSFNNICIYTPNLKYGGKFGDIISLNGNITFWNASSVVSWGMCKVHPFLTTPNKNTVLSYKNINSIMAYNGNINAWLFGPVCSSGGYTDGLIMNGDIIAKNINVGYLTGRIDGSKGNFFPNTLRNIATYKNIIATNNIYFGSCIGLYVQSPEDIQDTIEKCLQVDTIKADNIIFQGSLGYLRGIDLFKNLKEPWNINLIEGNNLIFNSSFNFGYADLYNSYNMDNYSIPNFKLDLNLKCSNFINLQGSSWGGGLGHMNINIYYNHNSASITPSINFTALLAKYNNLFDRRQRWIFRVQKDSPYNTGIYNGGKSPCYDGYHYVLNPQTGYNDQVPDGVMIDNLLTWQHGDNCYYNSAANVWVYYNL